MLKGHSGKNNKVKLKDVPCQLGTSKSGNGCAGIIAYLRQTDNEFSPSLKTPGRPLIICVSRNSVTPATFNGRDTTISLVKEVNGL